MKLNLLIPLLFLNLSLSTLANSTEEALDKLRIAVFIDVPYVYYENNTLVGYNIDIAKALGAKLNKQIDFLVCPVARCFLLMKNGQADIILDISKTPEREAYLSFLPSHRSQTAPLRFFTRKEDKINIKSYTDLYSLTIGAIRGAHSSNELAQDKKITMVPINTQGQLIKMLSFGRIDGFIEREESLRGLPEYKQHQDEFVISHWQYLKETKSYLAVSKKSPLNNHIPLITEKVNEIIQDGTIDRIFSVNLIN